LCGVDFYRRNLPHWHPNEKTLFITWRLYGSLPKTQDSVSGDPNSRSLQKEFREADAVLDRAESGPLWLKNSRVAALVADALRRGSSEFERYDLHAYVVMANHTHVLLTPKIELRKITKSLKGVTARAANKILGRTGEPFWQDESFDHWIRNPSEFFETKRYIEHNPVTAGLAERPEDWRWSSAYENPRRD